MYSFWYQTKYFKICKKKFEKLKAKTEKADLDIWTNNTQLCIHIATDCFIICLCNWYHL